MEKPEYFVIKPSTQLFGGIEVKKETDFETYNDDKTVHQVMKDLTLTTEIKKTSSFTDSVTNETIETSEESKMVCKVPEGTILLWDEQNGYIMPNYHMMKPSQAVEMLTLINETTSPIVENNNKVLEKEAE